MVNRIAEHEAGVKTWRHERRRRDQARDEILQLEIEYAPLIERHDRVKHYLLARAKRSEPVQLD